MRTIDRIIDCFMHSLSDCLLVHLGSSLLSMHYSEQTTIQWRLQYHLKYECQQEYNSRLEPHHTLLLCTENTEWRDVFHILFKQLFVSDTRPVKFAIVKSAPITLTIQPLELLSTIRKDYRHVLLGFPHRHRGEPQHKTLSFFFLVTETQKKPLWRVLYKK